MKKLLPLISILLIIMILFTVNASKTYAVRGCCSWHGGQAYCGSNGKWICQDGTESLSCTCTSNNPEYELSDTFNYDSSCNYTNYENKIEKLEKDKKELIKEKEGLETDKNNLLTLLIILGSIFILYICYKKKEN